MGKTFFIAFLAVLMIAGRGAAQTTGVENGDFRRVVDSRGVTARVPVEINRVATISDGLVESTLIVLGEANKLVAVGTQCLQSNYDYYYPSVKGGTISYNNGINTATFLHRPIMELPRIADWNTAPNFEAVAALDPDVLFIRIGSCWLWGQSEEVAKTLKTIESLEIPLIVLHSPNTFENPEMFHLSDEIRIIGAVFGKEAEAHALARYLESQSRFVEERTKDIPESEKPTLLLFGLSPRAREAGCAGYVNGVDHIDSRFIEEIVHARNAFRESGSHKLLSAEHVFALNPDVIILPTEWGYHSPSELFEAPYYQHLQDLKAVRNQRVAALPFTPCNCDKRLEYPIDIMVMAMAAYPQRFADVDLASWLLDFYQEVYHVDRQMAIKLRSVQFMDWTLEGQPPMSLE